MPSQFGMCFTLVHVFIRICCISSARELCASSGNCVGELGPTGCWTEAAAPFPRCPDSLRNFFSSLPLVFLELTPGCWVWHVAPASNVCQRARGLLCITSPLRHHLHSPRFQSFESADSLRAHTLPTGSFCDCHPWAALKTPTLAYQT